jgi:hypothetical protein
MKSVEEVFSPVIGQLAWSVKRGIGTFITMEFGNPHLWVREPISASAKASARVRRLLAQRRVFATGDWHLWVQYADWTLNTRNYSTDSGWTSSRVVDRCLAELDGQRLRKAVYRKRLRVLEMHFDLGAVLKIFSRSEIDGDRWSLHKWNRDIVSFGPDGRIDVEAPSPKESVSARSGKVWLPSPSRRT